MCGICGWLSLDGSPVNRIVVEQMAARLAHRGPDDEGYYFNQTIGLGQKRLSIIDLEGGHQPLANEDSSIWITYNGEIYNYRELMNDLIGRGHHFRTKSDTEVIIHAYEQWGLDCFQHLNGMFAFALWDGRNDRMLLARDVFGIKPLYYHRDDRRVLFASEIKGLFADASLEREIDLAALDQYLTFQFVPSPHTMFKNIRKLRPGHLLCIERGRIIEASFVRSVPDSKRPEREEDAIEELRLHLRESIRRQMISDVPVGALLSGGVDSAVVVALMQEISGKRVKTFTVGYKDHSRPNELDAARRSAQILGSEHYEIAVGPEDCMDAFDSVGWHLDEPVATPSILPMFWVSSLAARHVKVVLTGQGADEPWAGYRRYMGEKLGRWYRCMPAVIRNHVIAPAVTRVPRCEPLKRAIYALGTEDPAKRFTGIYTVFTPEMKQALYQDAMSAVSNNGKGVDSIKYWQSRVSRLDPLGQQLYVETRFSLPDDLLLYGDKMTMAWSIEARVPLLDLELMQFVESLPSDMKLKGLASHKYLYKKAIAQWVPQEILSRPKIGFLTPIDSWFQKQIAHRVRDILCDENSGCLQFFNKHFIEELIDEHVVRSKDRTREIFALLAFEIWHSKYMAGGRDVPETRLRTAPLN